MSSTKLAFRHPNILTYAPWKPLEVTHSPLHYYKDGTFECQVGSCLYNIYPTLIASRAGVFRDMFQGDQERDNVLEGSKGHPVYFVGIDQRDWDPWMSWLFGRGPKDGEPWAIDELVAIAKMSHLFDAPEGLRMAKQELSANNFTDGWSLFRKLALADTLDIPYWFNTSFRAIIRLLDTDRYIQSSDADVLGLALFLRIYTVRQEIELHRKALACQLPTFLTSPSCKTEDICKDAWASAWFEYFALRLVHPDEPVCDQDILFEMESPSNWPDLCEACHIDNVRDLKSMYPNPFDGEERIIRRALGEPEDDIIMNDDE
ncbi:hypothetical protein EVJ58_g598 [Rhodofomes roseus]|uniref:BTB domain-containing protein n=1 Tax=Rhodofomes roseus TaxID=34475 RepID=A0A4Y9Z6U4_9APHY|nr:hypothetical protein EVJ58_g598 [Rhodofomes roseus]